MFGITKIQFKDQMKPKKKEDQSMDAAVLIRRGKILTGRNMETNYGAETEGKDLIYSHQTQILLWVQASAW
jgi:hypothetical protein